MIQGPSQTPPWYPQAAPVAQQPWSPSGSVYNPGASGYNLAGTAYGNASMSHSMIPNMAGEALNVTQSINTDATRHSALPVEAHQETVLQLQELQNKMISAQMDPYVCGGLNRPGFLEFIYPFCDWTFFMMIICFIGSVVGLGLVLGDSKKDNLFTTFGVDNTIDLQKKLESLISVDSSSGCSKQYLFGSFGSVCMESAMNADTFAVQLGSWNTARGALWCIAAFFSAVAILCAIVVHVQRHPNELQAAMAPERQIEFMQMTPAQQQEYTLRLQQALAQQAAAGCCGGTGAEVYDTPYYAFLRVAWGFSGITALIWGITSLMSFWTFIGFYSEHSSGELKNFFDTYSMKHTTTTLVVCVFLCWPLLCVFLELIVWVVGFLPWLLIRTALKPGIERFRPSLPLSKIPGYIRCDMFFMDFQDIKRFGFSRLQWMLLTDNERPFFDCFEDPTLIRDPDVMNSMLGGLPMSMMAGATAVKADPNTEALETVQKGDKQNADDGEGRSRRRRHRSKSKGRSQSRRHRSRSRRGEDENPSPNENSGEGKRRRHRTPQEGSHRHRHRSSRRRSRSGAEGGEPRRHRSRKNTEEKAVPPGQTELDDLLRQ